MTFKLTGAHTFRLAATLVAILTSGAASAQAGSSLSNYFGVGGPTYMGSGNGSTFTGGGSGAGTYMGSDGSFMPGSYIQITDPQAAALCADLGTQLKASQAAATASRAPTTSPSQMINDQYGVNGLLATKIDYGSLFSGGFTGMFSGLMDNMAQSFINAAVKSGQAYFTASVNATLAKAGVNAQISGTFQVPLASSSGTAGQGVAMPVISGAVSVGAQRGAVAGAQLTATGTLTPGAVQSCISANGTNTCNALQ